jgi:hypothetical protein
MKGLVVPHSGGALKEAEKELEVEEKEGGEGMEVEKEEEGEEGRANLKVKEELSAMVKNFQVHFFFPPSPSGILLRSLSHPLPSLSPLPSPCSPSLLPPPLSHPVPTQLTLLSEPPCHPKKKYPTHP